MTETRDHGGGIDAARARFGGTREDWIDLSTGINPVPYPVGEISAAGWTALPDATALSAVTDAARALWTVPQTAMVVAAPGASALIARLPLLAPMGQVLIPEPTYNEHAAAFRFHGFDTEGDVSAPVRVIVHPNNPDGRMYDTAGEGKFTVIDESFCDVCPEASLIAAAERPGVIVLKSFGKFWGLAGARLGFAIGQPETLAKMVDHLGPWPVPGPTLEIAACALRDRDWADATRARLAEDAARLDRLALARGARVVGGTTLFRLYEVEDAAGWHERLARQHILTRVFPYNPRWIRFGLPHPDAWARLERAMG